MQNDNNSVAVNNNRKPDDNFALNLCHFDKWISATNFYSMMKIDVVHKIIVRNMHQGKTNRAFSPLSVFFR